MGSEGVVEQAGEGLAFSIERILADTAEQQTRDHPDQPVWIYCSRFSARPTAGPRRRSTPCQGNRRCRTAFTGHQVSRLKAEFQRSEYLSESGRRQLAQELGLTEAQVKIWFQNARAKTRKKTGRQSPLAQKLAEAGLYNHSSTATT